MRFHCPCAFFAPAALFPNKACCWSAVNSVDEKRQDASVSKDGGGNEGGVRANSRELGVNREEARCAVNDGLSKEEKRKRGGLGAFSDRSRRLSVYGAAVESRRRADSSSLRAISRDTAFSVPRWRLNTSAMNLSSSPASSITPSRSA